MGLFDAKVDQKDFDEFRSDIQGRFESLEQEIKRKTTDSEETARTAAANTVSIEATVKSSAGIIEAILKDLESYKNGALKELQEAQAEKENVVLKLGELNTAIVETQGLYSEILKSKESINTFANEIAEKVQSITTYLEQSKGLPESVANTQKLLDECKAQNDSVSSILDYAVKKKSDIDGLYKEIYGEDVKDSEGNSEHLDGLKDNLENSYRSVLDKITGLDSQIDTTVGDISRKHDELFTTQRDSFERLVSESNARISSVNSQLTGLLPGAMAEGLSAAYEKKKDDEVTSLGKFEISFKWAIGGMVFISSIPFAIDIYLLAWQGKELVQVLKETPSLIVAILPLYFPILWLAYSSNKKFNLSKRLIEEYTHKAVLGKTFSGLSNQIETLPHQGAVKDELRTRLLFNVLQVSAENPGKLITDYNKADHPLMEALENSAKLADSVDALSKIPGLATIAKKISEKKADLINAQIQKVENGLDIQASLEPHDDNSKTGST